MTSDAGVPRRRPLLLAVAVAGLLLGLIGMHHLALAAGGSGSAAATSQHVVTADEHGVPQPAPAESHGDHESALLHLCFAVLTAAAMLVIGLLTWRRTAYGAVPARVRTLRPEPAPRGPPRTAPARLTLLCVSRT